MQSVQLEIIIQFVLTFFFVIHIMNTRPPSFPSALKKTAAVAPLTKISQFEFPSLIDEEVLRLQVPVENFPLVTVRQAP